MEQQQQEGQMVLLPDDALADVLRRLPSRSLAVSRCVCKAWCAIVDARRILLPHLLPHSVGGIFMHFNNQHHWEFFSRPTTGPTICGRLDYLLDDYILDHCNGLLLAYGCVASPATRQWAPLPPCPRPPIEKYFCYEECLVFDPTVSPHYEVFVIPRLVYMSKPGEFHYRSDRDNLDPAIEESEWPPSPYVLTIFSSRTGQWEERSFVREGEPAGTIADMRLHWSWQKQRCSTYWQGALYVHFESNFVMRISLSDGKYQVAKPPIGAVGSTCPELHLGRSEKGVYFASIENSFEDPSCLQVWLLLESYGQMGWVLKHSIELEHVLPLDDYGQQVRGPWILQDINRSYYEHSDDGDNNEAPVEEKFEWNSDNDNVLDTKDMVDGQDSGCITFLGFHPYKEVVFLNQSLRRGFAFHLNSSKIQDLGNQHPTGYYAGQHELIRGSFLYTPCWMEFPQNN